MDDRIRVDLQQGVADVRLVRAEKMNALDDAMFESLRRTGEQLKTTPGLRAGGRSAFPSCLDRAPLLLPAEESAVGQRLRAWLRSQSLHPRVVAECDDSALAKMLGQRGLGLFVGPTVLEAEIEQQYGVRAIGRVPEVEEEFFVITVERRITHPCVVAITQVARRELFST